jgi:hypothetical protein
VNVNDLWDFSGLFSIGVRIGKWEQDGGKRGSALNVKRKRGEKSRLEGTYNLGSIRNGFPSLSVKFNFVDLDASSSSSALEAVADSPSAMVVDNTDDVDPGAEVLVDLNRAAKRA